MEVSPEPAAVGAARARIQQIMRDWGFGRQLTENVTTCVSEMVTNAIQASADLRLPAPVYVGMARERRWLLLAVADASPGYPVRRSAGGDDIHGRGLAIVSGLSTSWGWHPVNWPGLVKVVWAEWSRD
jgi:anti-sigma regulatory factor (Ser/Thr protein kinase)